MDWQIFCDMPLSCGWDGMCVLGMECLEKSIAKFGEGYGGLTLNAGFNIICYL